MTNAKTESTRLRERLLPQASIRFFLALIGISAFVMYTFRAGWIDDRLWAKIASLLLATTGACFVAYALLFAVANLFAATTAPLVRKPTAAQTGNPGDDHTIDHTEEA